MQVPEYLLKSNSEIIAIDTEPFLIKTEFLPFEEWPAKVKLHIQVAMDEDKKAQVGLDILGIKGDNERIKKFAYCRNGGFDTKADFTSKGEHNPEYFNCPLAETCPASAKKLLCQCLPVKNGRLTSQEFNIIELVAQDLFTKEIADKLCIAYDTAKNHIQNIKQKTGIDTKQGVVAFAYENGIIS